MKPDKIELPEGITIPEDARIYRQNEGYLRIQYQSDYGSKFIMLHRYIFEQLYGPLPEDYVIHHINGIPDDNRLENLAAMSRREHSRLHRLSKTPTAPAFAAFYDTHRERYHKTYERRRDASLHTSDAAIAVITN